MKLKVQGSELSNVDIDFVSLVKRGANRSPFKVVKAEDLEAKTGLVHAVQKFFQISEPAPQVVAVFVEKSVLEKAMPNLADAGFVLKNYELQDDVVIFKQDGFADCASVIMLKSEAMVGFAVANVAKHSDTFSGSLSFDPSVAVDGFYPGINAAMGALQATVNVAKTDIRDEVKAFETYVAQISKAIPEAVWTFESLQRGFGSGTTDLSVTGDAVKPTEIAKAATLLAQEILKAANGGKKGGAQDQAKDQTSSSESGADENSRSTTTSTTTSEDDSPDDEASRKAKLAKVAASTTSSTSSTSTTSSTEDDKKDGKMSKAAETVKDGLDETGKPSVKKSVRPKVMKDAEGKDYIMAFSPEGLVMKYSPGAKIPEGHTTMTEEWEQDEKNGANTDPGVPKVQDTADLELKDLAGGLKKEDVAALLALPGLVNELAKSVATQSTLLTQTVSKLEAIEKTTATAIKKAEGTVVHVGTNYDAAFENMGGGRRAVPRERSAQQIAKAEYPESLWMNSMGALESHIPGVEEV